MAEQSREPEILKSIIDDTEYNKTPQSRNEEILLSILNDTEYTKTPQSREEELLLELKEKIGHGITVEPLSVTENGTYTAPTGKAYSPVEVSITPPQIVKRVTGNPVEFSDGADAPVVKCVTLITGSQDLHGQDKPWPPGAGKNKFDPESTSDLWVLQDGTRTHNSEVKTVTRPVSAGENVTLSNKNNSSSSNILLLVFYDSSDNLLLRLPMASGAKYISGTAPANTSYVLASFYTWSLSDEQQLEIGVSFPTDYAPYSNICPITAYTEGEIEVRGKNILNPSAPVETFDLTGEGVYRYGASFEGNKTYTIINTTVSTNFYYRTPKADLSDRGSSVQILANSYATVTVPYDCILWLFTGNLSEWTTYVSGYTVMIGADTTYEPYASTIHTTTFPSAIYRGSEDVVNGTETHDMILSNLGDYSWTKETWGSGVDFYTTAIQSVIKAPTNVSTPANLLCSHYENVSRNAIYDATTPCISVLPGGVLKVRDSRYDEYTVENFKAAVSGVMLAYELATPTTTPVTPTNLPLKTLFGYNHIESSTGEMVLDYITDKYQNFVDTVNRAVPNTRKSGSAAMEVFMSLEKYEEPEQDPEDVKGESK